MSLADRFLADAEAIGKNMFVATSRRTPLPVESAMRKKFAEHPRFISGAWFHAAEANAPPLIALLGAAERIIVSADSVSMANEAVAAGVPTVAVYPNQGAPKTRHQNQFGLLLSASQIAETHVSENKNLGTIEPPGGWNLVTSDKHAELADKVLEQLGLLSR
jgi:mitochondrial fission protein ELM1